jgi:hypothetical protein
VISFGVSTNLTIRLAITFPPFFCSFGVITRGINMLPNGREGRQRAVRTNNPGVSCR